jgi:hypothetical protein
MKNKYGSYSSAQIHSTKLSIRKSIFFLLLYVDPNTKGDYPHINVTDAFRSLQYRLNGLNSILLEPPELVDTMSILESAMNEYNSECFSFDVYRKLILDAGSRIMDVKEGDQE